MTAALAATFLAAFAMSLPAADVVIVQPERAQVYEEAVHGFKSTCGCSAEVVILAGVPKGDVAGAARSRKPRMIFAVGPDSLRAVRSITDVPIVYSMVLRPETVVEGAWNATGIKMHLAPERQLSLMKKSLPDMRRVAVLYSSECSSNARWISRARAAAHPLGIELVAKEVKNDEEIPGILCKLEDTIDVLWVIPDATVVSPTSLELMSLFSMERKVPIVVFSEIYLKRGAFMSLAIDPLDIGKQGGEIAARILAGEDVRNIPPVDPRRAVVKMNPVVARKLGIPEVGQSEGKGRDR